MQIRKYLAGSVRLSQMPIVTALGAPSCWIRGEEYANRDGQPDRLSLEAIFDSKTTAKFVTAITSPEICALQAATPRFDVDEDSEGSGWSHVEVLGSTACIRALAAVAEALGAKRETV